MSVFTSFFNTNTHTHKVVIIKPRNATERNNLNEIWKFVEGSFPYDVHNLI